MKKLIRKLIIVFIGVIAGFSSEVFGFMSKPVTPFWIDTDPACGLVPRMPFGKHKGLKMTEVPTDYLQWLAGTDLDEDLAYTVRHYLGQSTPDPEYDAGI